MQYDNICIVTEGGTVLELTRTPEGVRVHVSPEPEALLPPRVEKDVVRFLVADLADREDYARPRGAC